MVRIEHYNIEINCGEDFSLSFTLRDDNGQTIDLTGATVTARLKEFAESVSSIPFVTLHNSAGGKVTLIMNHETTEHIGYTYGMYEVFVEYSNGEVNPVLYGDAKIVPAATKFPSEGTITFFVTLLTETDLPLTGEDNRLYYCSEPGIIYRWNGSAFVSFMRETSVKVGTTTTLEPGEDATVTNSGTDAHLVLDFGIPAGHDGVDGEDGEDGEDGFSPIASVSKSGGTTTITITDKDGTTTAEVLDGEGAGDVMGPNSATDSQIAVFDGATGKAIKDSGFTIGKSVPADAEFTDTKYSATTGTVGSASAGTDITADEIDSWDAGAPTSVSVEDGVLIIANGTASALSHTSKSIPNISVTEKTVVTDVSES